MSTIEVGTIEEAVEHGYRSLADQASLYLSPEWHKVEQDLALAPYSFHLLCRPAGQVPLAAAVKGFSVDERAWWPYVRVDRVLSRLLAEREIPADPDTETELRSLLPAIFLGASRGGTTGVRVDPGLSGAAARQAIATVLAALEDLARAHGVRSLSMLYVSPDDELLRQVLAESGYAEFGPTEQVAVLQVDGSTFEDYLSRFGQHLRSNIRRDRRRIARAGVAIELEPLTPELSGQMRLLEAGLYKKYGHPMYPAEVMRRLHESVMREYGESARVITARSDGVLRGYAAFIRRGDVLYSRDTGQDYTWKQGLPLYFEVLFYRMVELAMEWGIREIQYGSGTSQAKASRGCDIYPRFGYVKVLDQGVAELPRLRDTLSAVGSCPSPPGPAAESAPHQMA